MPAPAMAAAAVPRASALLVLRFMLAPLPGVRIPERAPVSPLLPVGPAGDQYRPTDLRSPRADRMAGVAGATLGPGRPRVHRTTDHTLFMFGRRSLADRRNDLVPYSQRTGSRLVPVVPFTPG